uniref:Transposase n=1 Tax=Schistosoma curassoni TaxID=6186 RepID=A0A183KLM6_9TREM
MCIANTVQKPYDLKIRFQQSRELIVLTRNILLWWDR